MKKLFYLSVFVFALIFTDCGKDDDLFSNTSRDETENTNKYPEHSDNSTGESEEGDNDENNDNDKSDGKNNNNDNSHENQDDKSDDNETSDSDTNCIIINGENYRFNPIMYWDGYWADGEGTFTVSVLDNRNNACGYMFYFISASRPKIGDNFAALSLTMTPFDVSEASGVSLLSYFSGDAVIKSFDDDNMTVKFSALTMKGTNFWGSEQFTYTFDGISTVHFYK